MPTLMEFIVAQSSLPIGNTVRDHIENPSEGGPGGFVLINQYEVEFMKTCIDVEPAPIQIDVEIDKGIDVELGPIEIDVEVSCGK